MTTHDKRAIGGSEYKEMKELPDVDFFEEYEDSVDKREDCWIWQAGKTDGYGVVQIDKKKYYVHRLALRPDPSEQVNHSCGNRSCVNPEHLYIGTQSDNVRDAVEMGTWVEGRARYTAVSEEDVRKIKERLQGDETHREIAQDFPIGRSQVSKIGRGEVWEDVEQ